MQPRANAVTETNVHGFIAPIPTHVDYGWHKRN